MAKRRYEQICVRFHLDDERDRRLFQIVTDLDADKFKSKNQFILNAIEMYIEHMGENRICQNRDFVLKKDFQAMQEEVEELKAKLKSEIRTELYEQLLSVLAGSTMANMALQNSQNMTQRVESEPRKRKEDSFDLGSGDGVLDDVMKWS